MMNDWIEIGTIVAPQGLAGEVRVYPNSELPERFLEPGMRWLLPPGEREPQQVEILGGRYLSGKDLYVVELEGIETREQAEGLRDSQLLVKSSDRPHLEDDEFYTLDLIGLEVINQLDGQTLGTVVDVMNAGHDVLEIEMLSPPSQEEDSKVISPEPIAADNSANNQQTSRRKKRKPKRKPPKQKKLLVPFVLDIVPVVDLEKGRIEITPPPGLIDL